MTHKLRNLVWSNTVLFAMAVSIFTHSTVGFSSNCNLACVPSSAQTKTSDKRETAIFVFHTNEFWLNLHHFLYVLGRAENKERDASREAVSGAPGDQERSVKELSAKEQTIWRDAVASYANGLSKKDLVFDDPLPAHTKALSQAGDSNSLTGPTVDPAITAILQRAAPIYRKVWWKQHQEANRKWEKEVQALVHRHGETVLAFITDKYHLHWPEAGFPVHVSAYSNWAGAYSTRGDLLVVSSLSPGNQGTYGLETIFHEGMHQWDREVFEALREQARKVNKVGSRGLSHALIFFTAG